MPNMPIAQPSRSQSLIHYYLPDDVPVAMATMCGVAVYEFPSTGDPVRREPFHIPLAIHGFALLGHCNLQWTCSAPLASVYRSDQPTFALWAADEVAFDPAPFALVGTLVVGGGVNQTYVGRLSYRVQLIGNIVRA